MMRRVPEVLDCWFESGSMPFAQVHYPFENREWFEDHYPGDFIVEYTGQTRGWFYTLHVLATALFDRPAFQTCVSHGIVLGDDGLKMSKSLRNYPDPMEVFDSNGADAMRWYLLSSPILRGNDFSVTADGPARHRPPGAAAAVERVVLPRPVRQRRRLPGRRCGRRPRRPTNVLDRYVLAKTHQLVEETTAAMDAYDLFGACAARAVVRRRADQLVHPPQPPALLGRRPRRHRHAAHRARRASCGSPRRCCRSSPRTIHDGLHHGRGVGSVHLRDWPSLDELLADDELVATMDQVRDVCSATLSVRKAHGRRVRQPLATLTVAVPDAERLAPVRRHHRRRGQRPRRAP